MTITNSRCFTSAPFTDMVCLTSHYNVIANQVTRAVHNSHGVVYLTVVTA